MSKKNDRIAELEQENASLRKECKLRAYWINEFGGQVRSLRERLADTETREDGVRMQLKDACDVITSLREKLAQQVREQGYFNETALWTAPAPAGDAAHRVDAGGVVMSAAYVSCPACGGYGIQDTGDLPVDCHACNGFGEVQDRDHLGRFVGRREWIRLDPESLPMAPASEPEHVCTYGSGPRVCETCGGTPWSPYEPDPCAWHYGTGWYVSGPVGGLCDGCGYRFQPPAQAPAGAVATPPPCASGSTPPPTTDRTVT